MALSGLRERYMWIQSIHEWGESLIKDSGTHTLSDKRKESLVTYVYVGAIFIILALIFILNTGISGRIVNLFSSLTLAQVPGTNIALPTPSTTAAHTQLYHIAFQFTISLGVLEIITLMVRILLHSPIARKAETIQNLVFWLGTSFLIITYLVNIKLQTEWFVFWAGIILIGGLSLVTRALIILLAKRYS
jgi:hypothetical protein